MDNKTRIREETRQRQQRAYLAPTVVIAMARVRRIAQECGEDMIQQFVQDTAQNTTLRDDETLEFSCRPDGEWLLVAAELVRRAEYR